MRLAVIVVNYRTPELVEQCLDSLWKSGQKHDVEAIVVDNDSRDGSSDRIKAALERRGKSCRARLIESGSNAGFAAGNNIGIGAAGADWFLLLNSDTIVRPGLLDELLRCIEAFPDAGIIAPRLEWPDGTPQASCFRWPRPLTEFIRAISTGWVARLLHRVVVPLPVSDSPMEPQWVSFAAVLIRREVLEQVGALDDGYFMYFEDIDFCRRAHKAGWRIKYWPAARVVHLRGGSSQVKSLAKARKRRPRYYYESRSRYFAKFYGRFGLWTANICWTSGRFFAWLRQVFQGKARVDCEREWRDIWTNAWRPLSSDRDSKATSHSDHAT